MKKILKISILIGLILVNFIIMVKYYQWRKSIGRQLDILSQEAEERAKINQKMEILIEEYSRISQSYWEELENHIDLWEHIPTKELYISSRTWRKNEIDTYESN